VSQGKKIDPGLQVGMIVSQKIVVEGRAELVPLSH
jgi:hypothetical protein